MRAIIRLSKFSQGKHLVTRVLLRSMNETKNFLSNRRELYGSPVHTHSKTFNKDLGCAIFCATCLNFYLKNARSHSNKLDVLEELSDRYLFDAIAITKTGLSSNMFDNAITVIDYTSFRAVWS